MPNFFTLYIHLKFEVSSTDTLILVLYVERYAHDDEAVEDQEETGWKYIHGDVFRFPQNKSLFAACLGSGTQLFAL